MVMNVSSRQVGVLDVNEHLTCELEFEFGFEFMFIYYYIMVPIMAQILDDGFIMFVSDSRYVHVCLDLCLLSLGWLYAAYRSLYIKFMG